MKKIILCLVLLTGCGSLNVKTASKLLIPVNIAAAYFSNLAIHEYSHAGVARYYDATDIYVELLPSSYRNRFYYGRTRYTGKEHSAINIVGPTSNFATSVIFRSALRSGKIPKILQPTFGWIDVVGRLISYYHVLGGLTRTKGFDLAKEDMWISGLFGMANLIYDVASFAFSGDDFETYWGVLFGERFYTTRKED